MSKRELSGVGLLFLTIIVIVLVLQNLPEIYAAHFYKYKPCLEQQEIVTPSAAPSETPIAYPILQSEEILPLALAYPGSPSPTVTPIRCSCQNEWETASFSLLTLQYPNEALLRLDSEQITLRIPTCTGQTYGWHITLTVIEPDTPLTLIEYVEENYSQQEGVKYREITVDGVQAIEVYETPFSNGRNIYLQHHSQLILISLSASSGHASMPGTNGSISPPEPDFEALGFFNLIVDSIDLL